MNRAASPAQATPAPTSRATTEVQLVARSQDKAVLAAARALGLPPLIARVLAGRLAEGDDLAPLVTPTLASIAHPRRLKDGERAAARIAQAVTEGEQIGILTDYDVDGITSHVVIRRTLHELLGVPEARLHSLIGHRINDGYGISAPLVEHTLALTPRPTLVITADCGSSDEARIARLAAEGIDVVVTDHHALPVEGPPASAYAVVNPSRQDCDYPDTTIAGCMVAWLVMMQTRAQLVEWGAIPESTPRLSAWLSYVALGTVADCVSLGRSAINRAVVTRGLALINRMDAPCWRVMAERLGADSLPFDAGTLGFQMGPRINARSRLDDPYAALHFMMAADDASARRYLDVLDDDNQSRKVIEADMVEQAIQKAQPLLERDAPALVIHLPEGHAGVQGIVASRLVQRYGRPTVILTNAPALNQLSGSGRSIEGVHLREALQHVHERVPGALLRFGGHSGAAGVTLFREHVAAFQQQLERAVADQLGERELTPIVLTDGELQPSEVSLDTVTLLEGLAPFGREFEEPLFEGVFDIHDCRLVGSQRNHMMLMLGAGRMQYRGIWFKALSAGQESPFGPGDRIRCAYRLARNCYRGVVSLQLMVSHAEAA